MAARAEKPDSANLLRRVLRAMMQHAVEIGMRDDDPTRDVKAIKRKSDGYHSWTDAEIAQFEARHPIGTKPRLALALLLYTGQRRSDVVTMGRQHIDRRHGAYPCAAVQDRRGTDDPGAPGLADDHRRHAVRTSDLPHHGIRQAVHGGRCSATGSENSATKRACRIVRRTVCARRRRGFWRKPDAPRMRLRPSPDTHRCEKFSGTPRLSIRPGWRSRR